ncbi:MAG: reverse transcriptase domain-containing protein [Candidatus Delongbacteria bacterium]|jgi:hypothetical protein|nr:reverse transcriptase domain-containing protein [Candidatus Delongbacteria bacterium]
MEPQLKDWFKVKGYPHIGLPLSFSDRDWVNKYVQNKASVSKHAFLPFIHKTIKSRKYRKKYDDNGDILNDGMRTPDYKKREIFYASHLDSNIYSYYSFLLSSYYESLLKSLNLFNVVTAYRRLPLENNKVKSRNKCNIDFANEVFEFIRNNKSNELSAIILDITSYFDHLDHRILKNMWCKILNVESLPSDHYNIYRNITKFSFVEEKDIFNEFQSEIYVKNKSGEIRKKIIGRGKYLRNQSAIAYCKKEDFNSRIRKKGLIKTNKYNDKTKKELRKKGIPQGSPISSVLANIYLMDFDNEIHEIISNNGGLYRRYSDDMVVVCKRELCDKIVNMFYEKIKNYKLDIQPSKTQIFHFVKEDNNFICSKETKSKKLITTKNFEYLGFEFDGQYTMLKSSSLASFYRKMKRTLGRCAFYAKYTNNQSKGKLFKNRLYKNFSYIGANRKRIYCRDKNDPTKWIKTHKYNWGNYLSYALLAKNNMKKNKIANQVKNHWKILNKLIKDKEKLLET